MMYIKNGRIYTRSFSFVLPEDMSIVTDPENVHPDTITFETADGEFMIEMGAATRDMSPSEQMRRLRAYDELVFQSDNISTNRGEMKGLAVYYHSELWRHEYYEEYLDHPMNDDGQNTFELCVQHEVVDESHRNQVDAFMNRPNIKSFLDSIRYEPGECAKIINS